MQPFDELAPGVYRRRYESLDLNIGVVVGDDAALVVDSRASHRQADELAAELTKLSSAPVQFLVNTHWHWDHVWGNARFPGVAIWGHTATRTEILENGEVARAAVLEWMPAEHREAVCEVDLVAPQHTFNAVADLDVGGRRVELRFHGRGHTDADIVIHVADAGVSFLGDLVEEGAPPNFGSSFPLEWPVTLAVIEPTLGNVVVPGHGDVVDRTFVAAQRREIGHLADAARSVAAGRLTQDQAIAEAPYPMDAAGEAIRRGVLQLTGEPPPA